LTLYVLHVLDVLHGPERIDISARSVTRDDSSDPSMPDPQTKDLAAGARPKKVLHDDEPTADAAIDTHADETRPREVQ